MSDFSFADLKVLIKHFLNDTYLTIYLVLSNVIKYDIKLKVSLSRVC